MWEASVFLSWVPCEPHRSGTTENLKRKGREEKGDSGADRGNVQSKDKIKGRGYNKDDRAETEGMKGDGTGE